MLHKILKNRKIWAAALLMVLLALGVAQAAGLKPQKSSLSGTVVSTVSVGSQVSEGAVLVTVKTLAGTAPAARANCNGKVVWWKFLRAARSQRIRLLLRSNRKQRSKRAVTSGDSPLL
jgi:predicted deacylase